MTPPAEAEPGRVLVVDDEPDIETLIRQWGKHRQSGFDFVFARNGREALDRLRADPHIDLVITDINMPVMDGLALLANLDSMNGRMIKAVILSAYGDMGNIRTAMNRGAFDFLTKPIDFQDFESTLKRSRAALASARQGLEARAQLMALQQELEIAARIQESMLPHEFEFPGRSDFELHARMRPARRVGGDFYDFFLIDDDRLGIVIGDVSGKGIPAALFMAVSRTLLRATALQGAAPEVCLDYANRILGRQGEPGVYVTAFYGILNCASGVLEFCIGGHNPPYRVSPGGELRAIAEPASIVVGLLPDSEYTRGTEQLVPGDSLFLFTDGVTEAMNAQQRFFGERRLKQALAAASGLAPREMVEAIQAAIAEFSAGAPPSDDVTAMALKWTPTAEGVNGPRKPRLE